MAIKAGIISSNLFINIFAMMSGNPLYGFMFSKLFCLILLLGLVFFVFWAIKNLKKNDLFHLAMTLIILGVLGLMVTASLGYGRHLSYDKESSSCGRSTSAINAPSNMPGLRLPVMMNNYR